MFLELFLFAKEMKFLTNGGIHCISRFFLGCSVDLKPGDCEMVVDGGRALQPCRL